MSANCIHLPTFVAAIKDLGRCLVFSYLSGYRSLLSPNYGTVIGGPFMFSVRILVSRRHLVLFSSLIYLSIPFIRVLSIRYTRSHDTSQN